MTEAEIDLRRDAGMTFIEVLASSVVLLFILLAAYSVIDWTQKAATNQGEIATMVSSGRLAVDLIASEIREAGRNPTQLDSTRLNPAAAAWISVRAPAMMNRSVDIRADLNGDGDTLDANEYLRFEWAAPVVGGVARLVRESDSDGDGVLDQTVVLADGVRRSGGATPLDIFSYLDAGGGVITNAADVPARARSVLIQFTVQTELRDRVTRQFNQIALRERVILRNLGRYPR